MRLKKLYEQWKLCRGKLSKYKINWKPFIFVDDENFQTFIIPTIGFTPWFNLVPDRKSDCMFNFIWFNMLIAIGSLETREKEGDV